MNYAVNELAEAVARRENLSLRISHLKEDLSGIELSLTPEGDEYKALGPNDTARKNALRTILTGNSVCQKVRKEIHALEEEMAALSATIAAVEIHRRAEEWDITRQLAAALGQYVQAGRNPGTQAGQVAGIESARQAALDALDSIPVDFHTPDVFEESAVSSPYDGGYDGWQNDIPF